jgi:hypothetical protein
MMLGFALGRLHRSLRMPCPRRSTTLIVSGLVCLMLGACSKSPPAPVPAARTTGAAAAPRAHGARSGAPMPTTAMPPAATASSAGSVIAPAPAGALRVSRLTLGDAVDASHAITRVRDSFAPDDNTLYASVATQGRSGGATLQARWSYLEGEGQLVSAISQAIATDGPAITTFTVHNPDRWPPGRYQVAISLDGQPVAKQDFVIRKG